MRYLVLSLLSCLMISWGPSPQQIEPIQSLTTYEQAVLKLFFRTLLAETAAGYTLYGDKPISEEGLIVNKIPLFLPDPLVKRNIILQEGYRIWERSGLATVPSNFAIRCSTTPAEHGWSQFLIVNKKSLTEVVNQNLPLFQYLLGPKTTAALLIDQLVNEKANLLSLLHGERVLDGIIFGYGIQNAIHGSRADYIHEYLEFRGELPFRTTPIKSRSHPNVFKNEKSALKSSSPSFGFSQIRQEFDQLQQEMKVEAKDDPTIPSVPWFGSFPNLESKKIMQNYRKVQKKIHHVLDAPTFLQDALSKLLNIPISLSSEKSSDLSSLLQEKLKQESELPFFLGQALSQNFTEKREVDAFIQGVLASGQIQKASFSQKDFDTALQSYRQAGSLQNAKKHLTEAERFFHALKETDEVIPHRVHYRILKNGTEDLRGQSEELLLSYTVSTPSDISLCTKEEEIVDANEIIPGLALGIKGMKKGEVREVYIHPAYGYGEQPLWDSEPNQVLVIRVKLLHGTPEKPTAALPLPLQSAHFSEETLAQQVSEAEYQVFFQLGQKTWDRFKCLNLSMDEVIRGLRDGKNVDLKEKWELVNQLDLLSWIRI